MGDNKGNIRKTVKWVIIGVLLTILTLFTALVLFIVLFFTGGPTQKGKGADAYPELWELKLHSGLLVYPEELTDEMSEVTFTYSYQDTWNSPTVCVFLQCTYTPEAYAREVERLEQTKKIYGGEEKLLLRDTEDKFAYPAYIAIENHHHQYEYALLTGGTQITYIHTAFFDRDEVPFDSSYLPTDFMEPQENQFADGYSVYIKWMDDGAIDYDYTRDENVEVERGYSEWIEDSLFVVRVKLDDQSREMITECKFCYYEPPKDVNDVNTYDEESDETYFDDLTGMEFKELKINEERTGAVVTYCDNDVIKEWEIDLRPYMTKSNTSQ